MSGLVILVSVALLGLLAARYGADARDGRDWTVGSVPSAPGPAPRRSPRADLAAGWRLARRVGRAVALGWRDQEAAWEAWWRLQHPWWDEPETYLRWQRAGGSWRLVGRIAPPLPPPGKSVGGPSRLP